MRSFLLLFALAASLGGCGALSPAECPAGSLADLSEAALVERVARDRSKPWWTAAGLSSPEGRLRDPSCCAVEPARVDRFDALFLRFEDRPKWVVSIRWTDRTRGEASEHLYRATVNGCGRVLETSGSNDSL